VLGWLADFFRFAWGLVYWNTRKSWFQFRRGRGRCPCQSPSDSGRAFETDCEACIPWAKPARFRRVCPLLVDTPDGLRCSVNTADVRPFWGRAALFYGGIAGTIYTIAVLGVFIFLRTVGYPVSIFQVSLPPLWHEIGHARSWFFLDRSNRAFAAGHTGEGLLYLANAYEFDPRNYAAGLALAKNFQAGQPHRSDEVFEKLMRDHPDKRNQTAEDWFRSLLSRGDFEKIVPLARDEVLVSPAHASVWMRALLFATRQTRDDTALRELLANKTPAAVAWYQLLETELLFRARRTNEARAALNAAWPSDAPPFTILYRVNALLDLRETFAALDLLERHVGVVTSDDRATLFLRAYAESDSKKTLYALIDQVLAPRLNPPTVTFLCTHLIRYPDRQTFSQLWTKLTREPMPMTTETAGAWFSLLCAAGAVGDMERMTEIGAFLKQASKTPFVALGLVEAFFRGETAERRITSFLPILPLPLEVTYALIERYTPGVPKRT
jgi:hypothetical protein